MHTRQTITVVVLRAGQHRWPEAPDEVTFLRSTHRHVFKVEATFVVDHADRHLEFFTTQRALDAHLTRGYQSGDLLQMLDFGARSCEMIAAEVFGHFAIESTDPLRAHRPVKVQVWEDGENCGTVEMIGGGPL